MNHAANREAKEGVGAVVRRVGVILLTLLMLNLVLYVWLPPAQPRPEVPHGEQARRAAEAAGVLAGYYTFDDDRGVGWYLPQPPNPLDGAVVRFMAQERATVTLPVGCSAPWTVELVVLDRPVTRARPTISATLDGQPLALTAETRLRRTHYRAVVSEGTAGVWAFEVRSSEMYRPTDSVASLEKRRLGAALDWVLVTGTGCGDGAG
jgi:hypothetical protein